MQKIVDSTALESVLDHLQTDYCQADSLPAVMTTAELGELKDFVADSIHSVSHAYSMQGTEVIFPPNADPRKRFYNNVSNAGNHSNVGAVCPAYIYVENIEHEQEET